MAFQAEGRGPFFDQEGNRPSKRGCRGKHAAMEIGGGEIIAERGGCNATPVRAYNKTLPYEVLILMDGAVAPGHQAEIYGKA